MGMNIVFTDVMVVTLVIMSVIIVIINGLCIVVISTSKILRRKTASILVYSLLFVHLLQGIFVIPFYAAKKAKVTNILSKKIICDGFRLTYMITFYGACINVLIISVDRLLAVKLIMTYKVMVTRKRVITATVSLWIYMFVLCLLPFIPEEKTASNASSICRYNQQQWWTTFMLFANTLVPYLLVIICYVYIFMRLHHIDKKTRSYRENTITSNYAKPRAFSMNYFNFRRKSSCVEASRFNGKNKTMRRITILTFIIVLTYGVTWAPSIIYYTLVTVYPPIFSDEYYVSTTESYVTFFIKFITFFDAIITPVIYCYFHDDFRQEFKKFWWKRSFICNSSSVPLSNVYELQYEPKTHTISWSQEACNGTVS